MKIFSWNVNGIRAAARKGLLDWVAQSGGDVYCWQEIKARTEQLDRDLAQPEGFDAYWQPAEKPGYSGVAAWTRRQPQRVFAGLGNEEIDREGRVLGLDYGSFVLLNAYFPNSQREHARLPFKLAFCRAIQEVCTDIVQSGRHIVLTGDFNIAHEEIDLANPKENQNNAGFLPEERKWMDTFLSSGFVDVFRRFVPEGGHYTWWSYRKGVRERNIGWRLDYFCVDEAFLDRIVEVGHLPAVMGSDHCPVFLEVAE